MTGPSSRGRRDVHWLALITLGAVAGVVACSSSGGAVVDAGGGSGGSVGAAGAQGTGGGVGSAGASGTSGTNGGTGGGAGGAAGAKGGAGGAAGSTGGAGAKGGAGGKAGGAGTKGAGGSAGTGGSARDAGVVGSGGSHTDGAITDRPGAVDAAAYDPCPSSGNCKVMPFGDSITAGDSNITLPTNYMGADYSHEGGYRIELFARAHADGKRMTFVGSVSSGPTTVGGATFPRMNEGHGGYTIDNEIVAGNDAASRTGISPLLDPPASVVTTYQPDIILLLIGINDLQHNFDVTDAPNRLGALLDKIYTQDAHVLVMVGTLLPTGTAVAPDVGTQLNPSVDAFNKTLVNIVATRAAAGHHVALVDLHTPFANTANYATTLLSDNIHPSAAGYFLLGDTWYAAIRPLLP
jgi:lysophospholipase L1-like esterase